MENAIIFKHRFPPSVSRSCYIQRITASFCYVFAVYIIMYHLCSEQIFTVTHSSGFLMSLSSLLHLLPVIESRTVVLPCHALVVVTYQHMLLFSIFAQRPNVQMCCYSCHVALAAHTHVFIPQDILSPHLIRCFQCSLSLLPAQKHALWFCSSAQPANFSLRQTFAMQVD